MQDRISRKVIGLGEFRKGVYYFQPVTQHATSEDTALLLHQRLGHPSSSTMSLLPSFNNSSIIKQLLDSCDICFCAKQSRTLFSLSDNKALSLFDLVHCDLWGPYPLSSFTGSHYFFTLVDDHSRVVRIYLLKDKSEVSSCLHNYFAMVKTQFGKVIKVFRSDNGTEFTSNPIQHFFSTHGILFQSSCVGTPQQNGSVERKHNHILEVARALRFHASLPIQFWGECIQAVVHLINRTPTKVLDGKTPYEVLFGSPPSFESIHVFGCLCYVHTNLVNGINLVLVAANVCFWVILSVKGVDSF